MAATLRVLLISLILAPFSVSAAAAEPAVDPVVAQIQFYGLKTVSEDRARGIVSAKLWAPYPASAQAADLTALLGSGLFTGASIRTVALSSAALRVDFDLTEGVPQASYGVSPSSAPPPDPHAAPAPPWVLGELEISGNRHVKRGTIRAQIKGRKGDLYDRADLDRDIQAVLGLGGFERVAADVTPLPDRPVPVHFAAASPSPWQVRLTFLIEEKPLVGKVEFPGRKEVSKGRLLDAMTLKKDDPFDRVKFRDDAEKVLEAYRKKGHLRATVEPAVVVDSASHKADLTFTVFEGPRSKLAAVRFVGAGKIKPKKLLKEVKNRPGRFFSVPFSEADLPDDLKKMEKVYKDKGFLDMQVLGSSVTFNEAATEATLTVTLIEGPQYRYGDTTFTGHTLYVSSDLAKALEYRRGKLFSQEKFDLSMFGIQQLYAEKGRLRAHVEPVKTFNDASGLMDVRVDIAEGQPVYVDHIDVEGYKTTKAWVFTREITLKTGDLFRISKLRRSQEKMLNLGFLDDVQPDVQSPYDPGKADILFEITEGKPGMLSAGAGFSSLDGLIGTMQLQHLNLLGRAWRTSLQWSFGARVNDFSVSWGTPWLREKPTSLDLTAYNTRRIAPYEGSSSAYTSKRVGGSVRLGPRFQDDKYRLETFYSFSQISIDGIETQFLNSLSPGTSIQSMVGGSIARDTRDNIWDPSRGSKHMLAVDVSGGPAFGDIHFLRPSLENSQHWTVATIEDYPLVLTAANRLAYVTQFGETKEVPVFDRFFIGGQDTLRGYSAAGEAGYRNGGRVRDVANIELGFPLARERRKTIVKIVGFYDIGASWDSPRTVRLRVGKDDQDIKSNVGLGIRFVTPAFPIRLDWGYGFQHRPGESNYQINFGIGNLF